MNTNGIGSRPKAAVHNWFRWAVVGLLRAVESEHKHCLVEEHRQSNFLSEYLHLAGRLELILQDEGTEVVLRYLTVARIASIPEL